MWRRLLNWLLDWRQHLQTLAWLVMLVVGVQLWQTHDIPSGQVPDVPLTLVTPQGQTETTTLKTYLARYPGQAVAVHVWAQWCPICSGEEGNVTQLIQHAPVLTIAMRSGDAQAVARTLKQRQLTWPTAVDEDGHLAQQFGVTAVPAFWIIDSQGQLHAPSVGYTTAIGMHLRWWLFNR
jgi:peroxiredoxin